MKLKLILLFTVCIVLSGCESIMPAPSLPNITKEQAFKTLEKFHKGHGGKLGLKGDLDDSENGKVAYLLVTDFSAVNENGVNYTISAGNGFAVFTHNPNGTWVLSQVTLYDLNNNYNFKPDIYVY